MIRTQRQLAYIWCVTKLRKVVKQFKRIQILCGNNFIETNFPLWDKTESSLQFPLYLILIIFLLLLDNLISYYFILLTAIRKLQTAHTLQFVHLIMNTDQKVTETEGHGFESRLVEHFSRPVSIQS